MFTKHVFRAVETIVRKKINTVPVVMEQRSARSSNIDSDGFWLNLSYVNIPVAVQLRLWV